MSQQNNALPFAIMFAALVISGSVVFFGLQIKGGSANVSDADFEKKVVSAIENYVKTQGGGDAEEPKDLEKVEGDFSDDDAVMGDKDAPVTMVEFSDYQCPYCAAFYQQALPLIKEKYIDTGKLKLIYRDYPLEFHPAALPAAMLAECVRDQKGDDAYYKMHDQLFETMATNGFDQEGLSNFAAEEIGVDKAELKECMDKEKFKEEVLADLADSQKAGIRGTPGFLINGVRASGARPFPYFEDIIEEALAETKE